jgi:hypothetical protein
MIPTFFKKEISIEQRFKERKRLLKPFLKLYKKPILVHSVNNFNSFREILKENKLKLPKAHSSPKKCPYMEKFLGIDNCIYYSLGFVYSTAYDFRYNLLFDLNYLKELDYYKESLIYQCYKSVIKYWYKHDKEYLEKLANTNQKCREVVNKYYNEKYKDKKRMFFDFWKIEEIVFSFIQTYRNKHKLITKIKETEKRLFSNYPYSIKFAKKDYLTDKIPEIIGRKQNNLLKNPYFLGFYIRGKITRDILKKLKKNYPNKILFDGKEIKRMK